MKSGNEMTDHGQLFLLYRDEGDTVAFERLMDAYNKPLFNYLLRLLHDKETAQDALQEVWLKVVRQRNSYKEQGQFSSWIYRIAHNYCMDLFRKRSHRPDDSEIVENQEGTAILDGISSAEPSPWDALVEKEMLEKLEEAVNKLPDPIREVYLLRTIQDVSFKEIAEIQGAPIGTVLSRMHQAVKRLQGFFSKDTNAVVEQQTA